MPEKMTYEDPEKAFDAAINEGRLTRDKNMDHWAGNYMYMGHHGGRAQFKNIFTRKYDV